MHLIFAWKFSRSHITSKRYGVVCLVYSRFRSTTAAVGSDWTTIQVKDEKIIENLWIPTSSNNRILWTFLLPQHNGETDNARTH